MNVVTGLQRWTLSIPTIIEFGVGSLDSLSDHASGYKQAIIITGRNAMKKAGVTDKVIDILGSAGVDAVVYNNVSPDPDVTEVSEAAKIARKMGADIVIGCGGGSAIDCAKAVAVMAVNDGSPMDYVMSPNLRPIINKPLPIIAISATSGTGSHLGRASVISDRTKGIKRSILSDFIYPKVAICDPEVLKTMPPNVTAASGFDAFTHALEGYLASVENPMGNICAIEAMKSIMNALPGAYKDGDNLELRSEMSWAETLAGVTLAANGITTPHAIAMVIGGMFGATHGCALAAITVAWLDHSAPGAKEKIETLAKAFGYEGAPAGAKDYVIEKVKNLLKEIDLDKGLAEYGVKRDSLESIAEDANKGFYFRLQADPVPPTLADIVHILEDSF